MDWLLRCVYCGIDTYDMTQDSSTGLANETVSVTRRAGQTNAMMLIFFQTIATNVMDYYHCLDSIKEKKLFLSVIAGDLGVDHEKIAAQSQHFMDLHINVRTHGIGMQCAAATVFMISSQIYLDILSISCHTGDYLYT